MLIKLEKILNDKTNIAAIPMRFVGPIKMIGSELNEEIKVPLATLEKPLWQSVNRGAKVSRQTDGVKVTIVRECMTRSVLVEAPDASYASKVDQELTKHKTELAKVVSSTSRFAQLQDWHTQIVGNLLFIRFAFLTGDAAGHNMTTKAAEALQNWLLQKYSQLKYISLSGNYCTDKKVSGVNSILGRGKHLVAELLVSKAVCETVLKTLPEKIVELNNKKNLVGSIIAGSLCSANAHFANMLLAFYLATGQDGANIVEGSQGITYAEMHGTDLYFSVTLPNIIVGTIGSGKDLDFVRANLEQLGCVEPRQPGKNARRLASIAAATVLCGELSLLAALTNSGELMRAHELERNSYSPFKNNAKITSL
jgi:hydroxymethylglutaryl-CoA reductase (NADPH)